VQAARARHHVLRTLMDAGPENHSTSMDVDSYTHPALKKTYKSGLGPRGTALALTLQTTRPVHFKSSHLFTALACMHVCMDLYQHTTTTTTRSFTTGSPLGGWGRVQVTSAALYRVRDRKAQRGCDPSAPHVPCLKTNIKSIQSFKPQGHQHHTSPNSPPPACEQAHSTSLPSGF